MDADAELVDLKVEVSGGPHARYTYSATTGDLVLSAVDYPDDYAPGDLCAVLETLTVSGSSLRALLLGTVSHPPGCVLRARIVGGLAVGAGDEPLLLAVAVSDPHFAEVTSAAQLEQYRREAVAQFARRLTATNAGPRRLDDADAQLLARSAKQSYRLAQAEQRGSLRIDPAWKALPGAAGQGPADETERHSAAEYAVARLPARFRQYAGDTLAREERLLLGIHRAAMRSATRRDLLRGKQLQEAVLLVGDGQVTELAELMPLDRAGVRYGFVARGGVPERLTAVEVVRLSGDVDGLAVTFAASGGEERVVWEFPAQRRDALEAACRLLRGWLPRDSDDRRLKRANLPEAPEEWPPLSDPGANDPVETRRLGDRLLAALDAALEPGETPLARCLLPGWIKERGAASLLALTDRRLLTVGDPATAAAERLRLSLPYHAVSSFEYCNTLLVAHLALYAPQNGHVAEHRVRFGSTLAAMDDCFRVLRHSLASTPPWSDNSGAATD